MRELRWIATADAGTAVAGVTKAPARAAEGAVRTSGAADVIPNGRAVRPTDFSTAPPNSRAARFGGHPDRIYATALNGFSATFSERPAAVPAAPHVERNRVVRPAATQSDSPSRGPDRVDRRDLTRGVGAPAPRDDAAGRPTGGATSPGAGSPHRSSHRASTP